MVSNTPSHCVTSLRADWLLVSDGVGRLSQRAGTQGLGAVRAPELGALGRTRARGRAQRRARQRGGDWNKGTSRGHPCAFCRLSTVFSGAERHVGGVVQGAPPLDVFTDGKALATRKAHGVALQQAWSIVCVSGNAAHALPPRPPARSRLF